MPRLRFSIADHFTDGDALFKTIAKFGLKGDVEPDIQTVSWQIMWSFLQRSRLGEDGFDVSEIGSTWVASFADMGALAELTSEADSLLGDAARFVPTAQQSVRLLQDERRFAVPFLADTRVVYYWRDLLAAAGVDESEAFGTPTKMTDTLSKLSRAGGPTWAAPTFAVTNVVHEVASWIWSGGGDFFTPDGTATAFCKDEALAGIVSYFNLHQYMTRKYDSLDAVLDAFHKRDAAVIMSGPWFYQRLAAKHLDSEALDNLGVALPPGPPFVGGSSLVMWAGADEEKQRTCLEWMNHLTLLTAQENITKHTGLLPVIKEAFDKAPYTADARYRVFRNALRKGRPLPQVPYWGALETELVNKFGSIWSDLKEDPRYTPERAVLEHLVPMAQIFDDKLYRHSFPPVTE